MASPEVRFYSKPSSIIPRRELYEGAEHNVRSHVQRAVRQVDRDDQHLEVRVAVIIKSHFLGTAHEGGDFNYARSVYISHTEGIEETIEIYDVAAGAGGIGIEVMDNVPNIQNVGVEDRVLAAAEVGVWWDDVYARAHVDDISARTAGDFVVALAAVQDVVAHTAKQRVDTVAAQEQIVAAISVERVGAVVAGEDLVRPGPVQRFASVSAGDKGQPHEGGCRWGSDRQRRRALVEVAVRDGVIEELDRASVKARLVGEVAGAGAGEVERELAAEVRRGGQVGTGDRRQATQLVDPEIMTPRCSPL